MHVFRQRAKETGEKVDFAKHFCQSLGLPYIFMAFVDVKTKKIVDSWAGRRDCSREDDLSDLIKAVKLRLVLHFTIDSQLDENQSNIEPDIMEGDYVWIGAGSYQICVGKLTNGLAPIIAFKQRADQNPDILLAIVKMGMAYVQLQLNHTISSKAAWQEKILKSTTRALSINIAVVSETGEIVHDGRSKKDSVGCVSGLKIKNNRFSASTSDLAALHNAISAATSDEKKTSTVSICGGKEGSQLLLVTPLVNSSSPLALIMFETQQFNNDRMCELFFHTYDLTASECRVAQGIIGGLTVAQTAEETGLSVATVRSYMKQVFAKTGTHRQSELISLYYQSILPMATGVGTLGRAQH